jgi:hypothetical protein
MEEIGGLCEAFEEVISWGRALSSTPRLHPELAHLCDFIVETIVSGVDLILSLPDPHEVEQGRLLLETEYLLKEVAVDPSRLDEWAGLEDHLRANRFGFGELRRREEIRENLPAGMVLAARDHYRVHSTHSHPFPRSAVMPPAADPRMGLLSDLVDLLGHAWSVLTAAERAVAAVAGAESARTTRIDKELVSEVLGGLVVVLTPHISEGDLEATREPRPVKQAAEHFWRSSSP